MFRWSKSTAKNLPAELSLPWRGSTLEAEEVWVPWGRKGARSVRCVQLSVAGLQVRLHPAELGQLVSGRLSITDSGWGGDAGFLVRAGSVSVGTDAFEWTSSLPKDAIALLMEPMTEPPPVVLSGSELASFSAWVQKLAS